MTLCRFGMNVEYRAISHLFGVGLSVGVLLDIKSVRQLALHLATDVSECHRGLVSSKLWMAS